MLNEKYKWLVAEVSLGDINKPTMRNTRDLNDIIHTKGLARKKRSASRVCTFWIFFVYTVPTVSQSGSAIKWPPKHNIYRIQMNKYANYDHPGESSPEKDCLG